LCLPATALSCPHARRPDPKEKYYEEPHRHELPPVKYPDHCVEREAGDGPGKPRMKAAAFIRDRKKKQLVADVLSLSPYRSYI